MKLSVLEQTNYSIGLLIESIRKDFVYFLSIIIDSFYIFQTVEKDSMSIL